MPTYRVMLLASVLIPLGVAFLLGALGGVAAASHPALPLGRRVSRRLREHLRRHARRRAAPSTSSAHSARTDQAARDFVVTFVHQFRPPLRAIAASGEFLLRSGLDPVSRPHVTTVTNEAARLLHVVNSVLDLRALEAGDLAVERIPFPPEDVAREVVALFAGTATAKRVGLRLDSLLPPRLLVTGDPGRFRQVLVNLTDNAVRYTPQGDVTVRLSYEPPAGDAPAGLLHLAITDTGPGISEEVRARLTTLASTAAGVPCLGTGLGLPLAHRLVRAMGTDFEIRSVPGAGTTVSFALPVPVPARSDETTTAVAAPKAESARILIVDDVAANRLMLQMYLEQRGYTAHHADSGEQAIRLAAHNAYDAILMDVQMPGMDGPAATRRIRHALPDADRPLIVAVTACNDPDTIARCLDAGMDAHFAKPLDLARFCRSLAAMIATRPIAGDTAHPVRANVTLGAPLALPLQTAP